MRLSEVPDLGPPDLGLTAHNKAKPPRATGSGPPKATLKPPKERTQPSGTPTLLADYRRRLQKAFKMTAIQSIDITVSISSEGVQVKSTLTAWTTSWKNAKN